MDKDDGCFVLGLCAMAAFLAFTAGFGIGADYRQTQAIERGYAIHDPQTGEWRWKTDSEVAE